VPVYKFQISMPVSDTLVRNRFVNTIHMEHVNVQQGTDLEAICSDLVAMYSSQYENATHEVKAVAYDTDAVPNYPRAEAIVNEGSAWQHPGPREQAICLSFCGGNGPRPRERGRIYLAPYLRSLNSPSMERPNQTILDWALSFYTESNNSFPDIGGIDWKFGVWSPTEQKFHQAQRAWVDDEWDTLRSRGLRANTRVEATREG
jgi:hypothetical protein